MVTQELRVVVVPRVSCAGVVTAGAVLFVVVVCVGGGRCWRSYPAESGGRILAAAAASRHAGRGPAIDDDGRTPTGEGSSPQSGYFLPVVNGVSFAGTCTLLTRVYRIGHGWL